MDELPRFLRVARAIAFVAAPIVPVACASSPPSVVAPVSPPAVSSATSSGGEGAEEASSTKQADPTEGTGPCRCSWDTNASAAPRVCKKGETNYDGATCVPGSRPKYPIAVGPLPPPDLPA